MKALCITLIMSLVFCFAKGQSVQLVPGSANSINLSEDALLNVQINSLVQSSFGANFRLVALNAKSQEAITIDGFCIIRPGISRLVSMIQQKRVSINTAYREFLRMTSALPPGEYQLCLELQTVNEPVVNYSDCIYAESYPLFDLRLNLPDDKAVISTAEQPFFFWFLISPLPLANVRYEMKLVEKRSGQSSLQAVSNNPAIFLLRNYASDSYQYQPGAFPLSNGAEYAWTVTASMNGFLLARAEPFEFKVQSDTVVPFLKLTNSYIDVRDGSKGNYFVKEAIKLRFRNFHGDILDYTISDAKSGEKLHSGIIACDNHEDFRVIIDLNKLRLKSNVRYHLTTNTGDRYEVFFNYVED